MLRSIKFIEKIAIHSRVAVLNASLYQRQCGEIQKCTYATRAAEQSLDNQLRWVKSQPIVQNADLKIILNRVRTQTISSQDAIDILKSCGRDGSAHTELVDEIWEVLKNKLVLDITHYNALLKVYIDKEKKFDPVKILEEMLNANIEPNRVTFNHLIRAFATQGNVDGVIKILEEMRSKGMPVNDFTYNNLILAFAIDGNLEKMHEIENLMMQKGFRVQTDTLNALLKGYAKTGRIEDINRTFDRFKEMKIVLLNKDVLDVLLELAANGHHQLIDEAASRLYKSIELPASLKSTVEKAVHRKLDSLVHKLLAIVGENDKTALVECYLEALSQAPAEKIEEAVKVLESHGYTLQTHPSLFEVGLRSNSVQLIRAILDEWKAKAIPIEAKHFWKLIELESVNGTDAILSIVHSMKRDFNVEPDIYTFRDVILPCMNATADPFLAIARLKTVESNSFKIARSLFERCLIENKMGAAYQIVNDFKTFSFNIDNLRRNLINAFVATGDVRHFVKIINVLQFSLNNRRNVRRNAADPTRDTSSSSDSSDEEPGSGVTATSVNQIIAVGNIVRETIGHIQSNPKEIEALLRGLVNEGLTISLECAQKINRDYEKALTDKAVELLKTLSSGELSPASLDVEVKRRHTLDLLSPTELEKMIAIEEEKGHDTARLKKILFHSYVREKNAAMVEKLAKTVRINNIDFNNIINMYIGLNDIQKALEWFNEIRKADSNFVLLRFQVVRLAQALFNAQRDWNEIVRIFIDNKQETFVGENGFEVRNFLRKVAETGNVAQLNELYTTLVENNYMNEDGRSAGVLIKAHLMNNDLPEAIRTFEEQYKEKKLTSGKLPLMKALIEANDMDKLQHIFDIVVARHSESNAVLSLAQSFIEVGNIRQAKAVLKNNLLRNSQNSFRNTCEMIHRNGHYKTLEGFLEAIEGLDYDRRDIYYYLLVSYCKDNKTEQALELWHKQLDEDERPTPQFLQTLAAHLKSKGVEVPFQVPVSSQVESKRDEYRNAAKQPIKTNFKPKWNKINAQPAESATEIDFRKALRNQDADAALSAWKKIDSNKPGYAWLTSDLVQLLTERNRSAEAVEIATTAHAAGIKLRREAFRILLQQIALDGNFEILELMGDSLPRNTLRSIRFGQESLKAYEQHNQLGEFFRVILNKIENVSDPSSFIADRIRMQALLQLLQKQSLSVQEFEEFATKLAEKGDSRTLNVLWAHHFLSESGETQTLYERLERDFPGQFKVKFLARHLLQEGDNEKITKLKEFLNAKNQIDCVVAVNDVVFDSLVRTNRTGDALAMIENGTIPVESVNKNALTSLKNRIIANGEKLPECISFSPKNKSDAL